MTMVADAGPSKYAMIILQACAARLIVEWHMAIPWRCLKESVWLSGS